MKPFVINIREVVGQNVNLVNYDYSVSIHDRYTSAQTVATQVIIPILLMRPDTVIDFKQLHKSDILWIAVVLSYLKLPKSIKHSNIRLPRGVTHSEIKHRIPYYSNTRTHTWHYLGEEEQSLLFTRRLERSWHIVEFNIGSNFTVQILNTLRNAVLASSDVDNFNIDSAKLESVILKCIRNTALPADTTYNIYTVDTSATLDLTEPSGYIALPYRGFDLLTNDPKLATELKWNIQK